MGSREGEDLADVARDSGGRRDLNLGVEHAHDLAQLGVLDNRKGPVA